MCAEQENSIKLTGEVNLGTIDIMAERERLMDEVRGLRQNHEEERRELYERLHQKELELIQVTFRAEIEKLAKMIEGIPRASFAEQLTTFKELAKELGYSRKD